MQALLRLSRGIDQLNAWVGKSVIWLILAATVISGVNAVVRKVLHTSSNAFLEVQWYLFAASFFARPLAIRCWRRTRQGGRDQRQTVSLRTRVWIDVVGFALFLTPMCLIVLYHGVPFFLQAWNTSEMSSNAGGLIRWPAYLMMPLGFGLLMLQGLSELIKRIAFLMGFIDDPTVKILEKYCKEELAEVIRKAEKKPRAQRR